MSVSSIFQNLFYNSLFIFSSSFSFKFLFGIVWSMVLIIVLQTELDDLGTSMLASGLILAAIW